MTYFLHLEISFQYSSATTQYQNLGQYIPYTLEYQIITQLPSDIHLKLVKLSINLAQYEKQYSPEMPSRLPLQGHKCHKIFPFALPTHTFLAFPLVAMCH